MSGHARNEVGEDFSQCFRIAYAGGKSRFSYVLNPGYSRILDLHILVIGVCELGWWSMCIFFEENQ